MTLAARDLNLSVSKAQADWQIDESLEAQIKETFSPRVLCAYRVGRMLGYSDERVILPVALTDTARGFGVAEGLADSVQFAQTTAEVDTQLLGLGYPVKVRWHTACSLWMRLAQGRAVLDALTAWLVGTGADKSAGEFTPPLQDGWAFSVLLFRASGAPKGYDLVLGPEAVTKDNSGSFDAEFRRIAWLPSLPAQARVPRPEHRR
jgi:hypothetical protein